MQSHRNHWLPGTGLALIAIVAAGCGKVTGTDNNSTVEIAGTVFTSWPVDAAHPINPVSGAIVSTSLDATTTTTDTNGKFDLKTTTVLSGNCVPYTVTITAGGSSVFAQTAAWGSAASGEQIILFPPTMQSYNANGCTAQ